MNGIDADDRGFTLGHGLFETVLFEHGAFAHWDAHLARLARGANVLGLPAPAADGCRRAAEAALAEAGAPDRAAVRVNWTAGSGGRGLDAPDEIKPRLVVRAYPAAASDAPMTLATAHVRRNDRSPASRLKTLAYLDNVLARAQARAAGADEALMLNTAGEVACAAAANLFWLEGEVVCTPALDCGVLEGVIRGQVLATCARLGVAVHEARATPQALAGRPLFVTNSLIGVKPVAKLDGADLPGSALIERLRREVA